MTYDVDLVVLPEQPAAVVLGHVATAELPRFLGEAFGEVAAAAGRQRVAPSGPPFGRYRPVEDGFDVEAGFPLSGPLHADARVRPATLPAGQAAHTTHVGSYGEVAAAYQALTSWLDEHGMVPAGEPWESYLDGPDVPEPRTEVFVPCAQPGPDRPSR